MADMDQIDRLVTSFKELKEQLVTVCEDHVRLTEYIYDSSPMAIWHEASVKWRRWSSSRCVYSYMDCRQHAVVLCREYSDT